MKAYLLAAFLVWQGCYLSLEHTNMPQAFQVFGPSASATAMVGTKAVSWRIVYIQPLRTGSPLVQVGASVRIF